MNCGKDAKMNKGVVSPKDTSAQIDLIKTMGVSKKISSDTSVVTMKESDLPQINGVSSDEKMQQKATEQPVKRGRGRPRGTARGQAQPRGRGRPRGRPPGSVKNQATPPNSVPTTPTKNQEQIQQINPVIVEDEFMCENSNSPKLLEPDQTLEDVVEQSALLTNNCNSTSTTSTTTLGNIELVSDNLLDEDLIEPDQTARIENAKIKAPTGRRESLRAIRVLGSLFLFLFIFTIFSTFCLHRCTTDTRVSFRFLFLCFFDFCLVFFV